MRISKRIPEIVGLVALVFVGACDTLNIANPNDPDRRRALGDANSIPSVAQGAFQTWYLTSQGGFGEDQYPALTFSVMARSHVAMWNNFHIRYYTGCTTDWAAGGYPAPLDLWHPDRGPGVPAGGVGEQSCGGGADPDRGHVVRVLCVSFVGQRRTDRDPDDSVGRARRAHGGDDVGPHPSVGAERYCLEL